MAISLVSRMACDCGVNITTPHATITFGDTHYNENAKVSCDKGYKVNGTSENNVSEETITCHLDGYWSNPSGCVKKDCRDPPTSGHSSWQYNSTTYESKAIFKCDSGYHTGNNTILTCNSSGHWDTPAPNCTDIDECTGQNTCHRNADCTNNIGSYMCLCKNGYDDMATSNTYDSIGRDCQDVNECTKWEKPCGRNAICLDGYDIDECTGQNTCHRNADCTNNIGSYMCLCKNGYDDMATSNTYDSIGRDCQDVNECTEWEKPCGRNAICLDGYEPVMLDFEKTPVSCAHGDNEILDPINIPGGRFPYLGHYFDVFRPNMNGFLALNYPPLYERYGAENSTLWEKYVDNHIVIAPLWTNIDTRNITGAGLCVHVLSNKTADAKDMKKIEDLLHQYTNRSDFSVDVAISLTWRNATIHSPYMPGYELIKQQNLSMQAIVVTDGLYTYLLLNYDQEQFSIQPDSYTQVAAGYTYPGNFSGKILADRNNFMNLKNGSNVSPAVKGRWLHNVTHITDDMWDELRCRKFHENLTLKTWTRQQLNNSYPCPCYEQDMKEDYTFKNNDSLWSNIDQYTHCYESWFFNPYDIKQRCCYRFGELRKEYPFAIGAVYMDTDINAILEDGFRQCCSAVNSRRYCHLYYDVNPPDDCSNWSPDDEGEY
ncbi:AGRE1-like protein, partial [Mya arenaria]